MLLFDALRFRWAFSEARLVLMICDTARLLAVGLIGEVCDEPGHGHFGISAGKPDYFAKVTPRDRLGRRLAALTSAQQ
jgi:hypothetical protein